MNMTEPALDNCVLKHNSKTVHHNSDDTTDGCEGSVSGSTRTLDKGQEMGILATKIEPGDKSDQEITYYGIHIPNEAQSNESKEDLHVYLDKVEALKVVKKHKKARFKVFKSRQEAVEFAVHGSEVASAMSPLAEPPEKLDLGSPMVGEKPSLFKGPKAQDLVQLRKAIEYGDLQTVKSTVWNNPRYLVSSGDTPAILQEGSRYNALHVAAKARNASMSEFIIQTVRDPAFVGLLYGDDDQNSCVERAAILLDLYLNTPDKGLNETPLHFAVKFGAAEVVDTLVTCPQCDKAPRNKFGQTPKDIVCSRVSTPDSNLKKEITDLLEERYYVPVWRSEDSSLQPIVGVPFQPSSPPVLESNDLLSPRLEIHAFAGPMNGDEAVVFRKKWKTPPRVTNTPTGSPLTPAMRLQDTEKGLERVGRNLAQKFNVTWREYWPFLGCYTDLSSPEGLQKLEVYLKDRFMQVHCSRSIELNNKNEDSITVLNTSTCSANSSVGNGAISPITDLCHAFKACTLSDMCSANRKTPTPVCASKINGKGVKHGLQGGDSCADTEHETFINVLSNPALSPLLYVEKSCQVFSKRIADYLIHMVENLQDLQTHESVFDMLIVEMKHLQVLVNSYMDDDRFVSVDFHFVHSRISTIVAIKLSQLPNMDIELLISSLQSVFLHQKVVDPGSSDEDDSVNSNTMYRPQKYVSRYYKRTGISVQNQVRCTAQHILDALSKLQVNGDGKIAEMEGRVDSEADCKRVWSDAVKCSCLWQTQNSTRSSRRSASFKRSRSLKNTGIIDQENCLDSRTLLNCVTKRLGFEEGCHPNAAGVHCKGDGVGAQEEGQGNSEFEQASDSDDDSFRTASSSPRGTASEEEEMHECGEGLEVYIEGDSPSKMDLSVLQAIEGCEITPAAYPNVFWWWSTVLRHSVEERNSWGTPSTVRRQQRQRAHGASSFPCSSPCPCRNKQPPSSPNAWHRIAGRYTPNKHNCFRD